MTWDNSIELAGVIAPVAVAIVVALIVSGRDDRRQRAAERRAVQRDTVIALQDGWLELDASLTNALMMIQRHQSIARRHREETQARFEDIGKGEYSIGPTLTFDEFVGSEQTRANEVNQSADEQNEAVGNLRQLARRMKLLESRVTATDVKVTSRAMRDWVEEMFVDLGSQGGQRYASIRGELYQPAYDRFIEAGYEVLADLDV